MVCVCVDPSELWAGAHLSSDIKRPVDYSTRLRRAALDAASGARGLTDGTGARPRGVPVVVGADAQRTGPLAAPDTHRTAQLPRQARGGVLAEVGGCGL